jgi:hypothetical protein
MDHHSPRFQRIVKLDQMQWPNLFLRLPLGDFETFQDTFRYTIAVGFPDNCRPERIRLWEPVSAANLLNEMMLTHLCPN